LSYDKNAIFALSSAMPGSNYCSITLFRVEQAKARYPLSIAGFETSKANKKVGGIGGRFMYS